MELELSSRNYHNSKYSETFLGKIRVRGWENLGIKNKQLFPYLNLMPSQRRNIPQLIELSQLHMIWFGKLNMRLRDETYPGT